jgi:hypothetical protein
MTTLGDPRSYSGLSSFEKIDELVEGSEPVI